MTIGAILGITRFDRRLLPFLEWIGSSAPPAMAVLIVYALLDRPISRSVMLAAWLIGAAVAIYIKLSGGLIHLFAGAATSLLVLAVGMRFVKSD